MYPLMYPLLSVYVETAPYLERFGSIACCTLVCALYLVFLVTKLPPITARLVASVPVLFFCIVAPLAFPLDEVITRAVVAFTTTWLLVFKTLALTLDRGALVQPGLNTWQRVAFGVLPLSPAADPVPRKGVASKHAVAKGEQGNGVVHKAQQQQQGLQQRRTTRSATREAATTGGADDENNIKSATVPTNGQGPPIVNKTPPPHTSSDPARSALQLLSRFYTKVLVLWVIVHALTHYTLPPVALTVCYGFGLYCFLGVLMDGPGTLLTWALRVSIAPHFRSPYAATSLGNLWGKRWNLTASAVLRALLYDPIVEGSLLKTHPTTTTHKKPTPPITTTTHKKPATPPTTSTASLKRPLASLLCFITSAIMHEILWWYITGHTTEHFMWFWFFTVHGLACVAEVLVLRVHTWPVVVRWAWTMLFFIGTGHLLFVPPAERAGVAGAVVGSLRGAYEALGEGLVALYARPVLAERGL